MLGVFLDASDINAALRALATQLSPGDVETLRTSLAHFAPLYRTLWQGGRMPHAFVRQAREEPSRADLERFLARMARFFAVNPRRKPYPRIVLVPVPSGGGTHAEAVGRTLLIEIREGEKLLDEVPPVVHENAHFLWYRMESNRSDRLADAARALPDGARTWRLFHEAVPTALGQGVAARRFDAGGWSRDAGWYHTDDVDECAKRIYPKVQRAMDQGAVFDEALLRKLIRAAVTPR